MTIQTSHLDELTRLIEYTEIEGPDGEDYSLDLASARTVAEEVLDAYLVIRKDELPEAKMQDGTVYAGNQAVSQHCDVDGLMEKALSYLSAATMIVVLREQRKAEEKRVQDEIIAAFNSIAAQKRVTWDEMSHNERLAGKEIVRLRGLQKSFM